MDVDYGVCGLFDLGEFDQKGSVRTKYGTKDKYVRAIQTAQAVEIRIYADVATQSNHRTKDGQSNIISRRTANRFT